MRKKIASSFTNTFCGIVNNNKCKLYRINGVEDHIPIFSDLHPSASLADYIKDIKVASNGWMKSSG
ncbi:MAG TPA: transposase, partial [Agriterribacter sp.]|nr:transposase [Agriterribacter sp.]